MKIFWIATGGALGSVLRYFISTSTYRLFSTINFPWGTLMVNASGSLLIGFLWGLSEANAISSSMRIFLFIGLLGGYTTFSAFSLETMNLVRAGEIMNAILNIFLSNVLGLLLAFGGFFFSKWLVRFSG